MDQGVNVSYDSLTALQRMSGPYSEYLPVSEFWHKTEKNADGTPVRCRPNGKLKTWKTRPGEFRLPVKYGLKHCFHITHENCGEWYIP